MSSTPHPSHEQTRPVKRPHPRKGIGLFPGILAVALFLALLAIGAFAAWTISQVVLGPYETRIYPNVYVLDTYLGGLTVEEAASVLKARSDQYATGTLKLSDGQLTWEIPWASVGLRLDAQASAQAAFNVGRDQGSLQAYLDMQREPRHVPPIFAIERDEARQALEDLAPHVAQPPTDATLRLENGQVVAVPGQPGRALDVDATLDTIVTTVAYLGPDNRFALSFRPVSPQLKDVEAAEAQAEDMLTRQVHIVAHDWLADNDGETFEWTLERDTIVSWMRIEPAENDSGPVVQIDEPAVRTTLENLAAQIGEGRSFEMEEATKRVLEVFQDGGGSVDLKVTHPPRTYTVKSGDDLTIIAKKFGMPPGLIAEVNRDIDPDWLFVGQEITIPSEDVLRPYPPVPGKRIEISTKEQRMWVYENDQLLYEWPVSTGIASSPTYTGHFQVLGKSEEAYASQWDLWMPHFIAVYRAGGGTHNGIHALPILSSGQRLWAGSLGSPASYGCIILGIEEAETLFNWAEIGVSVIIE